MKQGCQRACLSQLALWAGVALAFFLYARSVRDVGGETIAVSLAVGLFAAGAVLVAGSAIRTIREQAMLRSATAPPADGEWCAVSGELRTHAPVHAPLSGEMVSLYEYSISRSERMGKRSSLMTYFDGKSLAASSIGSVRLLSVPTLEVAPVPLDPTRAISNARHYVRRTTFAKRDTSRDRTDALEREWTDDDGIFRIDRRYAESEVELDASFLFDERHLKPGEPVCAFGVYSSTRGGLVPDERWGRPTRIMRGTASEIAQQLGKRAISHALLSIVLAAATVVTGMAYLT